MPIYVRKEDEKESEKESLSSNIRCKFCFTHRLDIIFSKSVHRIIILLTYHVGNQKFLLNLGIIIQILLKLSK